MENIIVFLVVLTSVILLIRSVSKGSKGQGCSSGCSDKCSKSSCININFEEKKN